MLDQNVSSKNYYIVPIGRKDHCNDLLLIGLKRDSRFVLCDEQTFQLFIKVINYLALESRIHTGHTHLTFYKLSKLNQNFIFFTQS